MSQHSEPNPWILALSRIALMAFSPPMIYAWRVARHAERDAKTSRSGAATR